MMASKLRSGQTLLFIGDSITDCGCRGAERPLGSGYVKIVHDLLAIREPAKRLTIINRGISGHTVVDLQNRWSDDVLRNKPDWLSIKIGINDLGRTLRNEATAVPPDKFARIYDAILARTVKSLPRVRLLLIDPFYISADRAPTSYRHEVLKLLPEYIRTVHAMSRKYRTRLAKTHEIFQSLLKLHDPNLFAPEPVHPNYTGHLAIAEAVYAALCK